MHINYGCELIQECIQIRQEMIKQMKVNLFTAWAEAGEDIRE